ncbi:MAG: 50S ribosomal protein L4 [Alphaproteobacteria bacterium]
MKLDILTLDNKAAGSIELSDAVFGLEPRKDILTRLVNWQLAKRRSGNHKVKQRSEVAGSTKRIGKQKGGGTARQGEGKAPQFRGGGVAHGPVVRSHAHDLTKKMRVLGLKHALSSKAQAGQIKIIDALAVDAVKTKPVAEKLLALGLSNVLFIDGETLDQNFVLSARNLPNIDILPAQGANVYDILRRHNLVLTKDAVMKLEERLK